MNNIKKEDFMKTSTKLGILGIVTSLAVQITIGVIEIRDYRKGKRRMAKQDIDLIAETITVKQDEMKKAKKNASKTVVKEA
jgi:hypothetical protein